MAIFTYFNLYVLVFCIIIFAYQFVSSTNRSITSSSKNVPKKSIGLASGGRFRRGPGLSEKGIKVGVVSVAVLTGCHNSDGETGPMDTRLRSENKGTAITVL